MRLHTNRGLCKARLSVGCNTIAQVTDPYSNLQHIWLFSTLCFIFPFFFCHSTHNSLNRNWHICYKWSLSIPDATDMVLGLLSAHRNYEFSLKIWKVWVVFKKWSIHTFFQSAGTVPYELWAPVTKGPATTEIYLINKFWTKRNLEQRSGNHSNTVASSLRFAVAHAWPFLHWPSTSLCDYCCCCGQMTPLLRMFDDALTLE